jgi:hypothetical protein
LGEGSFLLYWKVFTKGNHNKRKNHFSRRNISGMAKPIFPMHAHERNAVQQKIRESRLMQKVRKKAKKSASPEQCRKCTKSKNPRVPTNAENARKNHLWEKNLRLPGGVTGTEGCQL